MAMPRITLPKIAGIAIGAVIDMAGTIARSAGPGSGPWTPCPKTPERTGI